MPTHLHDSWIKPQCQIILALSRRRSEEILRLPLPTRASDAEQARGLPRYANTDFTFGGVTIHPATSCSPGV
jgi:hypothetical protein